MNEDDYSEAELIIGVGTGVGVYISIGAIIAVIAVLVFLGIKFKVKIRKISKLGIFVMMFGFIGIISCRETLAYMDAPSTTYFTQIRVCYEGHTYALPPGNDTAVIPCGVCAANGITGTYTNSPLLAVDHKEKEEIV